jgi:uncharacterized protein YlxP (DUF503 family)
MFVGCLTIELHLPGCRSLKQKRGTLKPILAGLHKQYNVSAAEIDLHDLHGSAVLACVVVSNESAHSQRLLARIPGWMEKRFPNVAIVDHRTITL